MPPDFVHTAMMAGNEAFLSAERSPVLSALQDRLHFQDFSVPHGHGGEVDYTLFRAEDTSAWVTFTLVFFGLITFDMFVLNRNPTALSMTKAVIFTMFWIGCAGMFCVWVYWYYGRDQAFMWLSGYMLEWMLSFDNLFVFHMIFSVYQTPDHLKHRPLYLGICGAIVFRLIFIFVGEYLMHAMWITHFIFGGFLVWTGFKTATADEDDEDPSQHPAVKWLQRQVPFVSAYDDSGRFFVRIPVDADGNAMLPKECTEGWSRPRTPGRSPKETDALSTPSRSPKMGYGTIDFHEVVAEAQKAGGKKGELRATMLFLVVLCLEISDLLFAVDSVSAIVAQVNDLFLAYTSCVFAMLGLRAMFFIIDQLANKFALLKYGVSVVLVFIGVKLIISHWYHVPPAFVCLVLVSAIGISMVASVLADAYKPESEDGGDVMAH